MGKEKELDFYNREVVVAKFIDQTNELNTSAEGTLSYLGTIVTFFLIFLSGTVQNYAASSDAKYQLLSLLIVVGTVLISAVITANYLLKHLLIGKITMRAVRKYSFLTETAKKQLSMFNEGMPSYLSSWFFLVLVTLGNLLNTASAGTNDWLRLGASLILGSYTAYGLGLMLLMAINGLRVRMLDQRQLDEWSDEPEIEKRKLRLGTPKRKREERWAIGDDGELVNLNSDDDDFDRQRSFRR